MMKILMYATVADELPYAQAWSEKTGHQIVNIEEPLSENTVQLAKGFDAIVTQQTIAIKPIVYQTLYELGIKQVSLRQVGYDVLDLPSAFASHIRLSNVAAYSPRAIAEFTLTQLFNMMRHQKAFDRATVKGDWTWAAGGQAREIHQLTVAIIGVGRIGTSFAQMLHALGATVLGVDPVYHAQNEPFVTYTTLDEALAQADVVSFHTPLNDDTRYMADSHFFKQLKPGTMLLNMARGEIVDMAVLEEALATGHISAAAFDVAPNENDFMNRIQAPEDVPDNIQRLMQYDNFYLTPHIAFYTNLAIKNMVEIALNDAIQLTTGGFTENEILR